MRTSFVALTIVALAEVGCGGSPADVTSVSTVDSATQAQVEAYNERSEILDQQLAKQEAELKRSSALLEEHEKQLARQQEMLDRHDTLLTKWEDQTRRAELVLQSRGKEGWHKALARHHRLPQLREHNRIY